MNIEELKDEIRDTFSDEDGDSFHFAVNRLWFILSELGHAYINVYKEFIVDKLGKSEKTADRLKYPLAAVPVIILAGVMLG